VDDTNGNVILNVTELSLSGADGFVASSLGAGHAFVNIVSVSKTQRGVVSLVDQILGDGNKYFTQNVGIQVPTGVPPRAPLEVGGNIWCHGNLLLDTLFGIFWPNASFFDADYALICQVNRPQRGLPASWSILKNDFGSLFTINSNLDGDGGHYAVGSNVGIDGTGLTSVDVVGGIVVGGSGPGGPVALAVSGGGTGASSFPNYAVICGNGDQPFHPVAPSAGSAFLVSNGISAYPSFRGILATDLPVASQTQAGIVSLSDQYLGAGTKFVDKLGVGVGSLTIGGVNSEFLGKAYFDTDIWVNVGHAILTYNAGVTAVGVYFESNLNQMSLQVPSVFVGGAPQVIARVKSFVGFAGNQDAFDLSVAGGNPVFSINGAAGAFASSTAVANPKSVTIQGGLVMAATAGAAGQTGTLFTATS
jgi:hypothetical protein